MKSFLSAPQAENRAAKLAGDSGLCEGQPWDHIDSIWDGWTGQCFGHLREEVVLWRIVVHVKHCAIGYYISFVRDWSNGSDQLRRYRAVAAYLFNKVNRQELAYKWWTADAFAKSSAPTSSVTARRETFR